MSLFRVDASIRQEGSASRELADLVEAEWQHAHPHDGVRRRELGVSPLPPEAWALSVTAGMTAEADRTPEMTQARALATELADELRSADEVLLAIPLYNFGVSQHAKAWIDLAISGAPSGDPLLEGTPTVLVTTRGGNYQAGTPREGWDHSTDYLVRVLQDMWKAELTVVEREFTLVGVNPALDAFTELAAELHAAAIEAARHAGRTLAGAPVAA